MWVENVFSKHPISRLANGQLDYTFGEYIFSRNHVKFPTFWFIAIGWMRFWMFQKYPTKRDFNNRNLDCRNKMFRMDESSTLKFRINSRQGNFDDNVLAPTKTKHSPKENPFPELERVCRRWNSWRYFFRLIFLCKIGDSPWKRKKSHLDIIVASDPSIKFLVGKLVVNLRGKPTWLAAKSPDFS